MEFCNLIIIIINKTIVQLTNMASCVLGKISLGFKVNIPIFLVELSLQLKNCYILDPVGCLIRSLYLFSYKHPKTVLELSQTQNRGGLEKTSRRPNMEPLVSNSGP